eukprot:14265327-Heterocapsa_arctica.AAC.1
MVPLIRLTVPAAACPVVTAVQVLIELGTVPPLGRLAAGRRRSQPPTRVSETRLHVMLGRGAPTPMLGREKCFSPNPTDDLNPTGG